MDLFSSTAADNRTSIEVLEETGRWRTRDTRYWRGNWAQLKSLIPSFEITDFCVDDGPSNPFIRSVVRKPLTKMESPIPVGVVSNTYTLAQHYDVAERCFETLASAGISKESSICELGLTDLGEWMNLRIYFPDKYSHSPSDKETLGLRLEVFNSVDGSCRLVLYFGWLRLVCSNGMVIGETMTEFKDIHNKNMDLDKMGPRILKGLALINSDRETIRKWEKTRISEKLLEQWANRLLTKKWGKKAACRTYHISNTGFDVTFPDPFAPGEATEKPVEIGDEVPGAAKPSRNLYDVSQALSFVATGRKNPEERLKWQAQIPALLDGIRSENFNSSQFS